MAKRHHRLAPLPGAIDGKRWKIRDAGASGATQTNLARREMAVPQVPTEEARQAQLHEMAHVVWSERDPARQARAAGVNVATLEGAEDCRLTANLAALGLPQDAPLLDLEAPNAADYRPGGKYRGEIAQYAQRMRDHSVRVRALDRACSDNRGAAALLLASYGTGDADEIRRQVATRNPNGAILSEMIDGIAAEALATDDPSDPGFSARLAQVTEAAILAAEAGEGGEGEGEGSEGSRDGSRTGAAGIGLPGGEGEGAEAGADDLDRMLDEVFAGLSTTPASETRPTPQPARAPLAPTPGTGNAGNAARNLLRQRSTIAAVANTGDNPGGALGDGHAKTDGTVREAPQAPPPVPIHAEREVRAGMDKITRNADSPAAVKTAPLAPTRRPKLDAHGAFLGFEPGGSDRGGRWGRFKPDTDTLYPPLRVRQGRAFLPKGRRAGAETGSVPLDMHRATIDGRVFRGPRRRDGNAGSVLIDVSGSMSLSVEQVEAILHVMPASVVACYSGEPNHLAILARKGRRVDGDAIRDTLSLMGGNNSIDGPALRWLARQRGPRFWISDGGITGAYDSFVDDSMRAEVVATCERARILRVGSVREVIARFGRRTTGVRA